MRRIATLGVFACTLAAGAPAAWATTLVMLVSQHAAVIASDSLAHGSFGGIVSTTRRKVSRVGDDLVIGTAGVAALVDETGTMTVDLHAAMVSEAARLPWREPR